MALGFGCLLLVVCLTVSGAIMNDGKPDCTLNGIASSTQTGIDPTFTSLVSVAASTGSGATIQFDTFNCAQNVNVSSTNNVVSVGIRPV